MGRRPISPYTSSCLTILLIACLVLITAPAGGFILAQSCGGGGGGGCGNIGDTNFNPNDGGSGNDGCSPIIIDIQGKGYHLTNAQNGVPFDMTGKVQQQVAWTAKDSGNAFLCLDRNGNGKIDNGKELFGNFTDQPPSAEPSGFLALAEFDKPENGGNGDGIIDQRDKIFSSLRLWVDANHDGISQADELFKLPDLGVFSINLKYKESRHMDRFGNQFRFRAQINGEPAQGNPSQASGLAYDVFLVAQ